jgi:predicted hydrolase (HD superfamily)
MTITREQASALLDKYLTTSWIKLHSRESEVILRAVAEKINEDQDLWGLTGLLHDLDMDKIDVKNPKDHGVKTCEILMQEFNKNVPDEMIHAIKSHVESLGFVGIKRESKLDFALGACENLSGFLVACALVMPDKKLASVKTESVIKKLKKKDFARNVNRQFIYDIEKVGLGLEEFITLALEAVNKIASEIGL